MSFCCCCLHSHSFTLASCLLLFLSFVCFCHRRRRRRFFSNLAQRDSFIWLKCVCERWFFSTAAHLAENPNESIAADSVLSVCYFARFTHSFVVCRSTIKRLCCCDLFALLSFSRSHKVPPHPKMCVCFIALLLLLFQFTALRAFICSSIRCVETLWLMVFWFYG